MRRHRGLQRQIRGKKALAATAAQLVGVPAVSFTPELAHRPAASVPTRPAHRSQLPLLSAGGAGGAADTQRGADGAQTIANVINVIAHSVCWMARLIYRAIRRPLNICSSSFLLLLSFLCVCIYGASRPIFHRTCKIPERAASTTSAGPRPVRPHLSRTSK